MNMNFTKFSTPVLGDETRNLYSKLYGEAGEQFVDILDSSPDEIAVISRLITYLSARKEEKGNGYAEDCQRNRTV